MEDETRKAFDSLTDSPIRRALESINNSSMLQAKKALEGLHSKFEPPVLPRFDFPTIQLPRIPSQEEVHEYQSAEAFIKRLAVSIRVWRDQLPEDQQPAIIAVLNGGIQINVQRLVAESFHGVRIEGTFQGSPCMVVAHQATVQLLCFVEPAEEPKRQIGFVIDGVEETV